MVEDWERNDCFLADSKRSKTVPFCFWKAIICTETPTHTPKGESFVSPHLLFLFASSYLPLQLSKAIECKHIDPTQNNTKRIKSEGWHTPRTAAPATTSWAVCGILNNHIYNSSCRPTVDIAAVPFLRFSSAVSVFPLLICHPASGSHQQLARPVPFCACTRDNNYRRYVFAEIVSPTTSSCTPTPMSHSLLPPTAVVASAVNFSFAFVRVLLFFSFLKPWCGFTKRFQIGSGKGRMNTTRTKKQLSHSATCVCCCLIHCRFRFFLSFLLYFAVFFASCHNLSETNYH